jgi:hypothetical protein
MDHSPAHTPYDGSGKPFAIGLKPLDLGDWIEVDGNYAAYLAEKRRLYGSLHDAVFVEEPETRAAQAEVLALIEAHLAANAERLFPDKAARAALAEARDAAAGEPHSSPLKRASLLVQEDLLLMRRDESGWRLAAGSLCFPSSWVLTEKFGRALHDIHAPVPGFGPGTRMAGLIERMFDSLQGQGVWRLNWSVQAGDALYHPLTNAQRDERATQRPSKFPDAAAMTQGFIRVERQTLRKLPVSGDILFTVRIYLDPLAVLLKQPERAALAASFADQLEALDPAQLDYKGLTADRDRMISALRAVAR